MLDGAQAFLVVVIGLKSGIKLRLDAREALDHFFVPHDGTQPIFLVAAMRDGASACEQFKRSPWWRCPCVSEKRGADFMKAASRGRARLAVRSEAAHEAAKSGVSLSWRVQ